MHDNTATAGFAPPGVPVIVPGPRGDVAWINESGVFTQAHLDELFFRHVMRRRPIARAVRSALVDDSL